MKKKIFFIPFLALSTMISSCGKDLATEVTPIDNTGVTAVILSDHEISIARGSTYKLSADVAVQDQTADKTITWLCENSSIVSVDNTGTLTALSAGTTNVTAIAGAKSDSCKVTVYTGGGGETSVTSLTLNHTSYTFDTIEGELRLEAAVIPVSFENAITWSSSNSQVASVSGSGASAIVTPHAYGENVKITATAGNKIANCTVNVKKPDEPGQFSISLDKNSLYLDVNDTDTIFAETSNPAGEIVTFQSSDPTVASVVADGNKATITANKSGTAKISATKNDVTAYCNVTVKKNSGDYDSWLASFSKQNHIYFHYLRTTTQNYDDWAVWVWQKIPEDSEGTLWGATQAATLQEAGISSMSTKWMSNADVGGVSGKSADATFADENGQIVDVDMTKELIGGKTQTPTYLINPDGREVERIGFLIVDQTKMTGGSHWESDGGAETYVRKFSTLLEKTGYLHIFCIEGQVKNFSTSTGQVINPNPTITDTTGNYRSQNDITNLKRDLFTDGVSTSESFLEDRPGIGYQIFVPSFADGNGDGLGDLRGIINKIDSNYFKNLGVGTLWLTPIQESGSYHGYDVTDYYKVDSKFGTLEEYQELIYKAHKQGIKVLMDMVINHTSKNNVLYAKSQSAAVETVNGKEINYRNMYLWKFKGDKVREWNGVEVKSPTIPTYDNIPVEESADWYKDGSSNYYYYGKFGSGMAELNYSCQATRDYMTDMCKYWLSFGLDGFRLDAIKHIYLSSEIDPSDVSKYSNDFISSDVSYRTYYDDEMQMEVTSKNDYTYDRDLNVKFWKEFAGTIKSSYPNCFLVGENFDGWNQRIAPFYEAIDSQFDFSTYYHLHECPSNGIIGDLNQTIAYNNAYRGNHINGAFTSNHDVSRMMNHAAVPYGDNTTQHAEVNTSNLVKATNQARFNAAVTILAPGVSWIYYGDELGMTGNLNDVIIGDVDDHGNNKDRWYRQPMKWGDNIGEDEVVNYGFGGLRVRWDNINSELDNATKQAADDNSMLSYFRQLGKAKSDVRYPTYGRFNWNGQIGTCADSCCFQVSDGSRTCNVFINNSDNNIPIESMNRGSELIACSKGGSQDVCPAHGFVVVKA